MPDDGAQTAADADYRLWVNDDSTMLVRLWPDGSMEVATRPEPGATWGPPTNLKEEAA